MRISSKLSTAFFFFFRQIGNLFGSLEIRIVFLFSFFPFPTSNHGRTSKKKATRERLRASISGIEWLWTHFFARHASFLARTTKGKGKLEWLFCIRPKFTIGELSITVRPRVRTSQSTNTRREFEGTRVQIVRKEKEKEDKLSCSKFHITLLITRKFLLSGIFLLCKNPAAHERS